MSTMTDDKLTTKQAESTNQLLEEVWEAIDAGDEYEGQDATEYLEQWPLEVVYEKGEPFAVVLGTGGPHVEITGGGRSGGYELHVYWAGDHATLRSTAVTRTGGYFRDMWEEIS